MPVFWGAQLLFLFVETFVFVRAGQHEQANSELKVLQLVAIVSVRSSGTGISQKMERGLDILPGARVAVQEVNRNSEILPGYQLELVEIIMETCEDNLALVQLIEHLTTNTKEEGEKESHTVGIIGPLCNSETIDLIVRVASHPGIALVQIAATQFPLLGDGRGQHPYLFQMVPITPAFTNTVIRLMEEFDRSKLAVLCSSQFLCRVASQLILDIQSDSNIIIADLVEVLPGNVQLTLVRVRESGATIVVGLLPHSIVSELICAAFIEDMNWPEYGWILVDVSAEDFSTTTQCDSNMIALATEGLILLSVNESVLVDPSTQLVSGNNFSTYNSSYVQELRETANGTFNFFASVFYDSVWAFALALNESNRQIQSWVANHRIPTAADITSALVNLSEFSGASGPIAFDSHHNREHLIVHISQTRKKESVPLGQYNHPSGSIVINKSVLVELPRDDLETVYNKLPLPLTVLFVTVIGLSVVFLTSLLFLHIYYHNEPEVKATKLARFMFLGCYLIQVGVLSLTVIYYHEIHGTFWRKATCQLYSWFTELGLFVFGATLLVRMIRVYRLFSHFGRLGKLYSNSALSVVVIGLVLVMVLILTVWAAVDVYQLIDNTRTHRLRGERPFIEVTQYCDSEYYEIWIVMISFYGGLILCGLVIVAVKTRKIHRAEFKDTKKVNFMVLVLVMTWIVFSIIGFTIVDATDVSLGSVLEILPFMITTFSFQFFLFLPKVWPLLFRDVNRNPRFKLLSHL